MARGDKRLWVALGAAAILIGGCSRGSAGDAELTQKPALPDGLTACSEIYGQNKVVDDKTFGRACSEGEDLVVPRPVRLTCTDGRELYWNDYAWGYLNDPMTLIDPTAPMNEQLPFDEAVECIKAESADLQARIRFHLDQSGSDDVEFADLP
jgi:hypothetical protein